MFDAGNLMIHLKGSDFGLNGNSDVGELEKNVDLKNRIESIRLEISKKAGLGDVSVSVLPKVALLTSPVDKGHIKSFYFTPKTLHPTHAVSGAICIAASSYYPGTIAAQLTKNTSQISNTILIEHRAGAIPVELEIKRNGSELNVISAGIYRTARKLMEGFVYY